MKQLLVTACLLVPLTVPALARQHCDLDKVQAEIRWCLVEAPAGIAGRERMVEALARDGNESDLFNYRIGFADCYGGDQDTLRNFLQCRRADPISVFNYGRELIDLPPVSDGS
jgi:hypothetical protein